jgi:hypothetical protein
MVGLLEGNLASSKNHVAREVNFLRDRFQTAVALLIHTIAEKYVRFAAES